jgi:hypothetical protein
MWGTVSPTPFLYSHEAFCDCTSAHRSWTFVSSTWPSRDHALRFALHVTPASLLCRSLLERSWTPDGLWVSGAGLRSKTWDAWQSWSGLGPNLFWGHRDPTLFFPGVLADPVRSCCLVTGEFGFTPCGDRHVHRNHMVGAVRLVGVYG